MTEQLDTAAATIEAYAEQAAPARVVVLLDTGEQGPPPMVEWTPQGIVVTEGDVLSALDTTGAGALPLPDLRAVPASAIFVDVDAAQIAAPLGGMRLLVEGVQALAVAMGGRSVAAVDFPTADPEVELTLAARQGEPVIAAVGEVQFQLPGE
jgi:hypothetical protein